MRIGYSYWGFLGSGVLDTPDGSRSYRRPFLDALAAAGHELVLLQANRDLREAGEDLTGSFRWDETGLPELDAVMVEWRWPLPGRNTTDCGRPGHHCDLHRQTELLDHYTHRLGLPTIVWDLDRQLPADDELRRVPTVRVCEFATRPTPGATTLLCPVPDAALDAADPVELARLERTTPLVYVGNQYDRDDEFAAFFAPAATELRHRIVGKWPRTGRWPWLGFSGRCGFAEVEAIHRDAVATVMLLRQRYWQVGHITQRLFEAALAGCVPIMPGHVVDGDQFVPRELVADTGSQVSDIVRAVARMAGSGQHVELIASCLHRLEPMRASRQARVVSRVLAELSATAAASG